jgi:hypothetical protein
VKQELYRRTLPLVMAALLLLSAAAQGQKKKPTGPRALAVIEWAADEKGNAIPRLVPLTLFQDGKFFDAMAYQAKPVPMSLEGDNVYEAEAGGELIGFFTVKSSKSEPSPGGPRTWTARGLWENTQRSLPTFSTKGTAEVVKPGTPREGEFSGENSDDRKLNQKATTVYNEEGKPETAEEQKQDADKDKEPRKGNPAPLERLPKVAKDKAPAPTTPQDDPDRPKLKRPGSDQPAASATKTAATPAVGGATAQKKSDDPDRPRLTRGKHAPAVGSSADVSIGKVPFIVRERGGEQSGGATIYRAVAVSDVADVENTGTRFAFRMNPSEEDEYTAKMEALAQAEAEKQFPSATNKATKTKSKTKAATAAGSYFDRKKLDAFDVDSNNSAELVFTGSKILPNGDELYATVVARMTVDDEPHKLFSAITTSKRLDVTPRMHLVDAVDADGDGKAELLFYSEGRDASEYVLYHVRADALSEVYRGAAVYAQK